METKFSSILTLVSILVVQFTFAQQKTITGTITGSDDLPLPGVNIIIKGTATGTQSDFDGNYSIDASKGDVLEFSFVGLKTAEYTVGDANTLDVILENDASRLDEVIVTALGIERKPKELSYSVTSLDNDDLTKTRSINTATAMVGKVSGLQINTIGSGVNPNTRVVLRGNRSLLGNNQALIVVDGFPTTQGVLDRINPNDIADLTVLKGANASALYGSEAANGVIIIKTKQGKGKLNVTFITSNQLEEVAYLPEFQTEFGVGGKPDLTLQPLGHLAFGPRYDGRLVDASETLADGSVWQVPFSPVKNNYKNFFNIGNTIRNSVTVSGGDENGDFLLSIDHSNVEGTVPKDTYNRTNVRLKGSRKYEKLEVSGNLSFFRSHSNVVGSGGFQNRPLNWYLYGTSAHIPLSKVSNWRTGRYTRNETGYFSFYENPYFIIDTQRYFSDVNEFTLIANAKYSFTEYLNASLVVGYTNSNSNYKEKHGGLDYAFHVPNPYRDIPEYNPSTRDEISNSSRVNSDFIVTFDKQVSDDFHATVHVGQNVRVESSKDIYLSGSNLIIPDFYNVSTRTGNLQGGESTLNYRKFGVYGDLTLGFKDFLFLSATARNDWTSALAKDNRSYFYPGAGISFVPTEAFPEIKGTLSYLKASFNITKTGNDPRPYATNRVFSAPAGFPIGTTAGLSLSGREPSPDLQPEFTTSIEAGIDFAFFRGDRLSGNITGYKTNTTDQIVPINTSFASGASSVLTNIGEIENYGLEVDFKGIIVRTDDFTWNLGVNYSTSKSEVIDLGGVNELEIGGPTGGAIIVAHVGESYPLLKTTDYQRDDQGSIIVGADGDPLKAGNFKIQGKTTPDYIVGANTTFRYKNFSFYAVMDYRTGHVFYNDLVNALEFHGLTQHSVTSNRQPFIFPNSVYSDGNGGYVANTNRPTTGGGRAFWSSFYNSTKSNYITDATTLKLREVSLDYTFNDDLIKKLGLQNLSIGMYGRNLFMWRPAENVYTDPEFNFNDGNAVGIGTQAQTAPTRQFGATLTAKF